MIKQALFFVIVSFVALSCNEVKETPQPLGDEGIQELYLRLEKGDVEGVLHTLNNSKFENNLVEQKILDSRNFHIGFNAFCV